MRLRCSSPVPVVSSSAFDGYRFPPEISFSPCAGICGTGSPTATSEELLASGWGSRSITSPSIDGYNGSHHCSRRGRTVSAAGPGDRWFVDETYVKVAGKWHYVYRAVDQYRAESLTCWSPPGAISGQHAGSCPGAVWHGNVRLVEVVTDRAPALAGRRSKEHPREFSQHRPVRQQPRRMRPRPTQSPTTADARTQTRAFGTLVIRGHALMQNIRRGHYELGIDTRHHRRIETTFTELATRSDSETGRQLGPTRHGSDQRNSAVHLQGLAASQRPS